MASSAVHLARPAPGRLEVTVHERWRRVATWVLAAAVVAATIGAVSHAAGASLLMAAAWPAAAGVLATVAGLVALLREERCVIDLPTATYTLTERTPFHAYTRGGRLDGVVRVRAACAGPTGDRRIIVLETTDCPGRLAFPQGEATLSERDQRRVVDAVGRFASGTVPPPRRWSQSGVADWLTASW